MKVHLPEQVPERAVAPAAEQAQLAAAQRQIQHLQHRLLHCRMNWFRRRM
ncbi:MAG: hypothetical protein HFI11_05185 [Lachnospiraceae bacterium]|nr:hypothetical protein [Lachnospiraceae bacterium]